MNRGYYRLGIGISKGKLIFDIVRFPFGLWRSRGPVTYAPRFANAKQGLRLRRHSSVLVHPYRKNFHAGAEATGYEKLLCSRIVNFI